MQKLQETKEKLFQEINHLVQKISSFSKEEDFLENVSLFFELQEKVISLKNFSEINNIISTEEVSVQKSDIQAINFEIDTKKIDDLETSLYKENQEEQNSFFEKIDEEKFLDEESKQENQDISDELKENEIAENSLEQEFNSEKTFSGIQKDEGLEKNTALTSLSEKKFKLAHIRGLNASVPSLFDEPNLESIEKEDKPDISEKIENQFIKDLKLDLNDKIAFSKFLFNGSQAELNEVARKIDEINNLEEAKTFLSDLYYQKNWENADEYAQRLWSLVENKFL